MKLHRPTVLVIEDEPELREILELILLALPVQVVMASDGRQALEIINRQQVTAIVSDINMPKMDGLQLLKEIRNLGLDTPFVFVSAYGDKENYLEALRLGATDFIEKPFDNTELLRSVKDAINLGRALESIENELQGLDISLSRTFQK
jgi:DNA-binding NtrC family response regulator